MVAGEQHIRRLLKEGVDSWNAAREESRNAGLGDENFYSTMELKTPDFSFANFLWAFLDCGNSLDDWPMSLAGIDLVNADLSHAMLRLVNLADAEFGAADLTGANLNETILTNADLQDAELQGARLEKANLTGADLRNAVLTGADLEGAVLNGADVTSANLIGANLSGTNLSDAKLFAPNNSSPSQYRRRQGRIKSISDLLNEARKLKRHHEDRYEDLVFYFRGESKCGWRSSPSVMRDGFKTSESNLLVELTTRRPVEFSEMPSALARWVLAQQHGLKTRFLDITRNPTIALFHACEHKDEYKQEDARLHIFAVPKELVKSFNSDTASVISNFARLSQDEQDLLLGRNQEPPEYAYRKINSYQDTMARLCQFIQEEKPSFQNKIDVKDFFRVFVVEPQQISERLRAQSGAFLMSAFHERFERGKIEEQVPNVPVYAHYTLTVPYACKPSILQDLQLINITRETLYPGLDESAKAITRSYVREPTEDIPESQT